MFQEINRIKLNRSESNTKMLKNPASIYRTPRTKKKNSRRLHFMITHENKPISVKGKR